MFEKYLAQFPQQGVVEFHPEQNLRKQLANAQVPDKYGVYLIYGVKAEKRTLVYIGKAGTLETDGVWRSQGLRRRLQAKQDGMRREKYFRIKLSSEDLSYLSIHWVVTVRPDSVVLPAKAEADLLQIYFDEHAKLPPWNRAI